MDIQIPTNKFLMFKFLTITTRDFKGITFA